MTDALTERAARPPYDGQPVIKIAVKVTNAGDGLSESIGVDGLDLHLGQEVDVVLGGCVVAGVDLRPIDKDDPSGPLVAKYVLKAGKRATITDDARVADLLAQQEARIRAAKGEEQLPGLGAAPPEAAAALAAAPDTDGDGYYDPAAVDPS